MAPSIKCIKCNESLKNKNVLKCCRCKYAFDTQCAGKDKLFQLMSADSKKSWVCHQCRSNSNTPDQILNKKPNLTKKTEGFVKERKIVSKKQPTPSTSTDTNATDIDINKRPSVNQITSTSTISTIYTDDYSLSQSSLVVETMPDSPGTFHSASSTPSQNKVTYRKKVPTRQQEQKSSPDINLDSSSQSYQSDYSNDPDTKTMLETSFQNRSLPCMRTTTEDTLDEYKIKINNLELRLQSAELEVQNLILENGNLKKIIQENEQTIKKLTHICSSTSKKKKSKLHSKSSNSLKSDLNKSQANKTGSSNTTPSNNVSADQPKPPADNRNRKLEQKNPAHHTINIAPCQRSIVAMDTLDPIQLCVISNRKNNGVLSAMECTFESNVKYCHYNTPNRSIKELLNNLEEKLMNYTMKDYCVIFVSEVDLNDTQNSIQLVNFIRESLSKITHTNKIVCLPTYICGALIYNYKVEMFGNLLAMDMQSNNYAYIFDTNRNLTLSMFSRNSGKITKFGIRAAFQSLKNFMLEINNYLLNREETPTLLPQQDFQSGSTDNSMLGDFFRP